jgi:hypothetical protein
MNMCSKLWSTLSLLMCLMLANGCLTASRGQLVSKVESFPSADRKPSIYMERYEMKLTVNNDPPCCENEFVAKMHASTTLQNFGKSGLFSKVDSVNFGADYTMHIQENLNTRINKTRRTCSFVTLGIFPCVEYQTYKLTAYVKNNKTGVVIPVEVKETTEVWTELFLLPVALFIPKFEDDRLIYIDLVDNLAIAARDAIIKHEQGKAPASTEKSPVITKPPTEDLDAGLIKKLTLLKNARESGVLTEQEYQQKRAELLKGL